jgi:hypothetical protein
MPEATVNEYRFAPTNKRQVRRSGNVSPVQPISVPELTYQSANNQLRLGISLAYARHEVATLLGSQAVKASHGTSIQRGDASPSSRATALARMICMLSYEFQVVAAHRQRIFGCWQVVAPFRNQRWSS